MTFLQSNQDTDKKAEKPNDWHQANNKIPIWRNERYIQACAWALLTIGLCIIFVTFYVAIVADRSRPHETSVAASNNTVIFNGHHDMNESYDTAEFSIQSAHPVEWLGPAHHGRVIMEHFFEAINSTFVGCQEILCKIACTNDANLFTSVYKTMRSSSCSSIDVMLLESQKFSDDTLKNSWMSSNRSVHEIVIQRSNLTRIKASAFNSPMFRSTLIMSWSSMNIHRVESGALLGLYKLKYLTIESFVQHLEPAFFQPVQTTLHHLKLNANLALRGNKSIFGVSFMNKLEYLDLSLNRVNGSLGRRMFGSTPNLKYFVMTEAGLTSIQANAFDFVADKLIFLNLSKNRLTTLAAEVLQPIFQNHVGAMIKIGKNQWICNCDIMGLKDLFTNYRNQFIDALLCVSPHKLYGMTLDEVDYSEQNCITTTSTTTQTPIGEILSSQSPSTKTTTKKYTYTPSTDVDSTSRQDSSELSSNELTTVFKMRCFNTLSQSLSTSNSDSRSPAASDSGTSSSSSSSSSASSSSSSHSTSESIERNLDPTADINYFSFPPPIHDFDVKLIDATNMANISIENPGDLMVIWFSEQQESTLVTYNDLSVDYECMRYARPNLMVGPLVENTTYTFCLIPGLVNSISPFNCLPLHVPLKREHNIWISQENKQFTIGMLCLIFLVSTILGGMVAYFGIKTYPDLLEGSKNVLVVKKPDQACYVATISETEYLKKTSLKKRKPSSKAAGCKSSSKSSLPTTPASGSAAPPFHMSVKNLESFSSGNSSSTCFEDSFPSIYLFNQDDYETPKISENEYTLEQRTVNNTYGMSPGSPPPLPKRNSNISDSPTVVMNRFSKNS